MKLTDADLQDLLAECRHLPAGPWTWHDRDGQEADLSDGIGLPRELRGPGVAILCGFGKAFATTDPDTDEVCVPPTEVIGRTDVLRFVARSRTLVPALVSEIKRLRAENTRLRSQ